MFTIGIASCAAPKTTSDNGGAIHSTNTSLVPKCASRLFFSPRAAVASTQQLSFNCRQNQMDGFSISGIGQVRLGLCVKAHNRRNSSNKINGASLSFTLEPKDREACPVSRQP